MRAIILSSFLLIACDGGDPTLPVGAPVTFGDTVAPDAASADLPLATIDAVEGVRTMLAFHGLGGADGLAQGLLGLDGVFFQTCWQGFTQSSIRIDLDYTPCSAIGAGGFLTAERLSQANAIGFTPDSSFVLGNRDFVSGRWVMTPISDLSNFRMAAVPWPDPTVLPTEPAVVKVGGQDLSVQLYGRSVFSGSQTQWKHWGRATVTGPAGTADVMWGSAEDSELDADRSPMNALTDNFIDECRCAATGSWYVDAPLLITEVTIDLNDALVDGGTIWPTLAVTTDIELSGRTRLRAGNECGTMTGSFNPDDPTALQISGDELRASIEAACASNAFGTEENCGSVTVAAAAVDSIAIELDLETQGEMIADLAARQLAGDFCTI